MDNATLWWIAAAVLAGAELLTGTFYLLMLALGMAAAALVSYMSASTPAQWLVAACVSICAVVAWHVYRTRSLQATRTEAIGADHNATRNKLDIGGMVMIDAWQADGTANVHYRGTHWKAIPADAHQALQTGRHQVVDIQHNQLVVTAVT